MACGRTGAVVEDDPMRTDSMNGFDGAVSRMF
jgi:hypothetical protein